MISRTFFRAATAAIMMAAATATAWAAVVPAGTVQFNGWAHPQGHNVTLQLQQQQRSTVQAGGFDITLSGFSGANALQGNFEAYCVELAQHVGLNSSYKDYEILSAGAYFGIKTKVRALTQLVGFMDTHQVMKKAHANFKDEQSTAMQLAIWNIVYDTDDTIVHSSTATFSEAPIISRTDYQANKANSDGSRFLGADALLAGGANFAGRDGYDLYVLRSPKAQDQLVWTQRGTVPEPTSLALVALALGGAGFAARRRR